jgi:hypothetical protein
MHLSGITRNNNLTKYRTYTVKKTGRFRNKNLSDAISLKEKNSEIYSL